MKWFIALLVALGAAAAVGVRHRRAVRSAWNEAADEVSSFAKTAADTVDDVTHKAAQAASAVADDAKSVMDNAVDAASAAADETHGTVTPS
jgi:hypothetical protein